MPSSFVLCFCYFPILLVSFLQGFYFKQERMSIKFPALNAIKGAMKILARIHHLKNVEENLPSIATYILYMEESLSGLVVGPFFSATCRKQCCRRVEQASTYSVIKAFLLELEENICIIILSRDWVKLVNNWLVEASVT